MQHQQGIYKLEMRLQGVECFDLHTDDALLRSITQNNMRPDKSQYSFKSIIHWHTHTYHAINKIMQLISSRAKLLYIVYMTLYLAPRSRRFHDHLVTCMLDVIQVWYDDVHHLSCMTTSHKYILVGEVLPHTIRGHHDEPILLCHGAFQQFRFTYHACLRTHLVTHAPCHGQPRCIDVRQPHSFRTYRIAIEICMLIMCIQPFWASILPPASNMRYLSFSSPGLWSWLNSTTDHIFLSTCRHIIARESPTFAHHI